MWLVPRVSIRGPLAPQPREPAGQAHRVSLAGQRVRAHLSVPVMTQSHLMHFLSILRRSRRLGLILVSHSMLYYN